MTIDYPMKRDPHDAAAGASGDSAGPQGDPSATPAGASSGPQGSGGAQGTGARKYDSGPIDVVALARGLDGARDAEPPPPLLKASQVGNVLKPGPPPLPLWVRILIGGALAAVCSVVGVRVYRAWMEHKAAEAAIAAAAAEKAAKEAKERAAIAKAAKEAKEAKEAEERAEAEKKAAAERDKARAAAEAIANANANAGNTKGHHHGSDKSSSSSRSHHGRGGAEVGNPPTTPVDTGPLPAFLTRDDILKGMQSIQSQVSACFAQYHVPGTALVGLSIASSGRVQKANVAGPLAGTPSGDCVAKAVRGTSFSRFSGKTMSVQYPIVLR